MKVSITKIVSKYHWWFAGALLLLMLALCIGSMRQDSATTDEIAHIPAGYSYLEYHDYRLNPEHPPLMKVLAAIPLTFMHLKFPIHSTIWTQQVNSEWSVGYSFLYYMGNNAGHILFWARLPIVLVAVTFGAWLYWFLRRKYGEKIALLVLFFYALSPNILANARYVTTDLGITVFIFVALAAFACFVAVPSKKRLVVLSLALAAAQLAKVSAAVLYPLLAILLIGLLVIRGRAHLEAAWKRLFGGFMLASVLSIVWVCCFYESIMWKMPVHVQQQLILTSLTTPHMRLIARLLYHVAAWPGGAPLAQFILGILMVQDRLDGGTSAYFWGHVDPHGSPFYFPALLLLKTQLSFLILLVVTAIAGLVVCYRCRKHINWEVAAGWMQKYLFEVTLGVFVVVYFAITSHSTLDLGIRYILPIYPPLFVLVALGMRWLWRRYHNLRWRRLLAALCAGLLIWYGAAAIWIYPDYLAYFNELIGGPANADKYFQDSSIDWGQDLVRLQAYIASHPQIHTIALDYFGGGNPRYYFCTPTLPPTPASIISGAFNCNDSHVIFWNSRNGHYTGQYIAVSESYLVTTKSYAYLRALHPIARIGYSIYVYKLY